MVKLNSIDTAKLAEFRKFFEFLQSTVYQSNYCSLSLRELFHTVASNTSHLFQPYEHYLDL